MKKISPEQRTELESLVKKTKDINQRNRACVVLARDDGHEPNTIARILRVSLSSIYDYLNDYDKYNKTNNEPHKGASCKLTLSQEQELKKHLSEITYPTTKSICSYVQDKYNITYTPAGMLDWLHRNGFSYKAPKLIPGKLDPDKQAEFIKKYEELKAQLSDNEKILFMDAVHPEYQSQSVSGWILKDEVKTLGTTANQHRLHINGAIDVSTSEVFTQEYTTINSQSIIAFLSYLAANIDATKIHIICDNARTNKNKELAAYLATQSRFQFHYLSPYSPNLNPIERLWKVMREHVTHNRLYQSFADFGSAVRNFFATTVNEIQGVLKKRINDNFEIIKPNPINLSG